MSGLGTYFCQTRVNDLPQIHLYAKLAWTVFATQRVRYFLDNLIWVFTLSQAVTTQIDRDDRMRRLWEQD